MSKLLLVVVCGLFHLVATAQVSKIETYQFEINRAEHLLVQKKYPEALETYQRAFFISGEAFTKDIFNALSIAAELGNQERFFQILPMMADKCIPQKKFEEIERFKSMSDDTRWATFFSQQNCPTGCIDKELLTKSNKIAKKYQAKFATAVNDRQFDEAFEEWANLVKEEGYISEFEIGAIDFSGKTIFDELIVDHVTKRSIDKKKTDLRGILTQAVTDGKLAPQRAAYWIDLQNDPYKTGILIARAFGKKPANEAKLPKSMVDKINEVRSIMHLESIEQYATKHGLLTSSGLSGFYID